MLEDSVGVYEVVNVFLPFLEIKFQKKFLLFLNKLEEELKSKLKEKTINTIAI